MHDRKLLVQPIRREPRIYADACGLSPIIRVLIRKHP